MEPEVKTKEMVFFGELAPEEAMKTEGGFVIVVNGTNEVAPEATFAMKVTVPEGEPSQITLQRAMRIFGNTVGLKGLGIVPSPAEKE